MKRFMFTGCRIPNTTANTTKTLLPSRSLQDILFLYTYFLESGLSNRPNKPKLRAANFQPSEASACISAVPGWLICVGFAWRNRSVETFAVELASGFTGTFLSDEALSIEACIMFIMVPRIGRGKKGMYNLSEHKHASCSSFPLGKDVGKRGHASFIPQREHGEANLCGKLCGPSDPCGLSWPQTIQNTDTVIFFACEAD